MMEKVFFDSFFYNYISSFFFLIINFFASYFLSQKNQIVKTNSVSIYILFSIIISFYVFLINLLFLFNFTEYLQKIVLSLTFVTLLWLIISCRLKFFSSLSDIITNYKLILAFLFIFFLISIMPISDADSIALHLNIPGQIINYKILNNDLTKNLENILISNTESLLTLSYVFKSDNFGSQLNFFALLIFFLTFRKNKFFFYLLLCTPLIIFFISTQKLQLFFGLLYLNLFILVYENKLKSNFDFFLFIFLLTFYSSGKLTYILFSIFLFSIFLLKNKKSFKIIFLFLLICFLIHQFPILLYKFILFDNPFAPLLDHYFKDREILSAFTHSIRASEGWLDNFTLTMIFRPFIVFNISTLTTIFGLAFIFLLFDFKKIRQLYFLPYLIIISMLSFGQLLPRYFLEAFLLMAFYANYKMIYKVINICQGILVISLSIIFLFYSFFYLQKDSWSKKDFSRKFTYTYLNSELLKKKKINENILVIPFDRDSIFFDKNVYSSRYINVLTSYNGKYQENLNKFIKDVNIKFIIFDNSSIVNDCIVIDVFDEINFKRATRNYLINEKESNFKIGKIIKNDCK
jgi:hypothetical protein